MALNTLLVTGAAGGLGSALCLAAAERGLSVIMLDRDQRGLERIYDRIVERGWPEPAMQITDLASMGPDEAQEITAAIESEFGGLDALVHCAARFDALTPLEHVPPQEWLQTIQVNLNAAWLLTAQCLPLLRNSSGGRLYFILEDLDRVAGALWGPYGISKHAVQAMVGQLAEECQTNRVQVLGINPGPMQSPLRSRAFLAENPTVLPAPSHSAGLIVELLLGELEHSGLYVDLPNLAPTG